MQNKFDLLGFETSCEGASVASLNSRPHPGATSTTTPYTMSIEMLGVLVVLSLILVMAVIRPHFIMDNETLLARRLCPMKAVLACIFPLAIVIVGVIYSKKR